MSRAGSSVLSPHADPAGRWLLVGVDGRPHDGDATALGVLIQAAFGGRLLLVHVPPAPAPGRGASALAGLSTRAGRELLDRACAGLDDGVEVELAGPAAPAAGLRATAEAHEARIIVLGSSHRGRLSQLMPGAVASHLLAHAPCALAVAPAGFGEHPPRYINRLAVAYDSTRESAVALRSAGRAAERLEVPLIVFYAIHRVSGAGPSAAFRANMRRIAERVLAEGTARLPPTVRVRTRVLEGDTATMVLGAASEEGVGLLFLGSRGYGPLREALLQRAGASLRAGAHPPLLIVPYGVRTAP